MENLLQTNLSRIKYLFSILQNYSSRKEVFYIIENAEWAIKYIGKDITENLNKIGMKSRITLSHKGILNSFIHFGSINAFMPDKDTINIPHKSNKVVVTYFHVMPGDERLKRLQYVSGFVDLWHTPNNITKEQLTHYGIPKEKIIVIPLGVDINRFKPLSFAEKYKMKQRIGLPKDRIIIGSFQKDGLGWDEGLEPKLIKGPDIFCDVVESLAKKYPIFVLLIGPARGYIKRRLEKMGIPYKHYQYIHYTQIHKFYPLVDVYLIASRIEGGPRALLECMSSSIPFVTTRVGMVPDIVTDYENGLTCDIDDVSEIIKKSRMFIEEASLKERLCVNMRETSEQYSWDIIIRRYHNEIYAKLKMN